MCSSNIVSDVKRGQGDKETRREENILHVSSSPCHRVLVVGLGNPVLGDDGVGWRVAQEVEKQIAFHASRFTFHIDVDYHVGGGLGLMERMVGYDAAIVIDALNLGRGEIGTIHCFELDELPNPSLGHLGSAHETNLQTALELGRQMGVALPQRVMVVGVQAENVFDLAEEFSPSVAAAVPQATQRVMELLTNLASTVQG